MGTSKPVGGSFFQPEHVDEAVDMLDVMLGREGAFAERPFLMGHNTFVVPPLRFAEDARSEEHTSELQSRTNLVCRFLLEKKNNSHKLCRSPDSFLDFFYRSKSAFNPWLRW